MRDEVAATLAKGAPVSRLKSAPPVTEVEIQSRGVSSIDKATSHVENVMLSFNTVSGAGLDVQIDKTPVSNHTNDIVSKMSEPNTTNEWLEDDVNAKTNSGLVSSLNDVIRGKFFDKCKFISVQKINNWDSDPNALCLKISKAVNVKKKRYELFWKEWAGYINKTLNNRRTDVGNLVQRAFIGKLVRDEWTRIPADKD